MKIFLQICAILVIVATISICTIKPEMHKTVLVYNSDYKIITDEEVKTETVEIPIMEIQVKPQEHTVKKTIETVSVPKTQTNVQKPVQTVKKQTSAPQIKTEVKTVVKPAQTTVKTEKKQEQQVQTVVKQEQPPKPQIVKTTQTQTQTQAQKQTAPKVLTQQEEEIAWNVWRSNLQNQIMKDVRLPALPTGIVFKFTFDVDKFGKISNIYTYSENPAYTPYAIQYIAPVIRSYQGKSILNFPQGSSRTSTEFKGGWKISTNERLSTPNDYNDYEKVTKSGY